LLAVCRAVKEYIFASATDEAFVNLTKDSFIAHVWGNRVGV
jgi:hypothetical protein